MKTLYVFSEELSMKKILDIILPKILPEDMSFQIFVHQGKHDLEKALASAILPVSKIPGARILIIRDQDDEDCKEIKKELIDIVGNKCYSPTLFRIVCRQLECWFLGDLQAIEKAFPRFKADCYQNKATLRDVDNIVHADKILLNIIPDFKHKTFLPKIETADRIAPNLVMDRNKSVSFRHFIAGVQKLTKD